MTEPAPESGTIKLGKYDLVAPASPDARFSGLIWGPSGCGKSTLAATVPGKKKLFLMFDADGERSIAHRNDILTVPLYTDSQAVVEQFKYPDPLGIEKTLKENPDIEAVIMDSITTFSEAALYHGVTKAASTTKGKSSTIEDPGFSGYGNKNTWTHLMVTNLLRSTARLNRHMVFIAHEGAPDKNSEGAVTEISMILGSNLAKEVPIKISEVWAMYDTGKERRIAIRPSRMRTPMKTRMFDTSGEPEFVLKYDPLVDSDDKAIKGWYEAWKKNNFRKIPLPK